MKKVAVITRTKNRPLMLQRALKSVMGQIFTDFDWIIINDGGDPKPVNEIINLAKQQGIDVIVKHHEISKGMEAASNTGINISSSKYIVIHDDDDSWEPAFLKQTINFLESKQDSLLIKGVVTRTTKIFEKVNQESIVIKKKIPYDSYLCSMTLFKMARLGIVPPPISFVYRRDVLETIGLYREDLPVLGDWEFNLRFLSHYEIAVIPEYLANYHWRDTLKKGDYRNTVVADIDIHETYTALLRNELLRKDLREGKIGIGFLVNLCHEFQAIQIILQPLSKIKSLIHKIMEPIKYFYRVISN